MLVIVIFVYVLSFNRPAVVLKEVLRTELLIMSFGV